VAQAVSAGFEMRGIRKTFGGTTALDGVDLAVAPGEVCALVGQNGAGKSTLMGILSGALQPNAGSMTIDGQAYAPRSPSDARHAGVAMIYQELSLAPHLTVAENIALGVEPTRFGLIRRAEMRSTAQRALTRLGHADIDPDRPAGELSVAEQQLVEIARALASGCRVLVLDEPTSSLAHGDVRKLFEIIGRLKQQGLAVVYISHFIEEVMKVSDRFVVLRDGHNAGEGATSEVSAERIVGLMVGRTLQELYPRRSREIGEPVLMVNGLGADRGEPVTFALRRGEIFGIAGLLGAGRTHLLRMLFGLERVRSGDVKVGAYVGPWGPADCWDHGMGMLSEDRTGEGLATSLTIADNMTLTRLDGLGPAFFVSRSRQRAAAVAWIDRLGIKTDGPSQRVAGLSGGNQQKVALARLLHHDVDVLLLDEPTRGIDVSSKAEIYRLVDELVSGRTSLPKAVLIVSSYFPELLALCDRIAVMSRGRLGAPRPASSWTEHSLLMEASTTSGLSTATPST
jgi:ribose transport system ATP-binding protein